MSDAEEALAAQLAAVGIPHTRQAKFAKSPKNRWFRADFAFPEHGLLVEVQGGGYSAGRHHRPQGYASDCVRMGRALALGWRLLYVTPQQVTSGEALQMVQDALRAPERPCLPAEAPKARPRRSKPAEAVTARPLDDPEVHELMHRLGCTRARAEQIAAYNARR